MKLDLIFFGTGLIFLISAIILPWINYRRINQLHQKIEKLLAKENSSSAPSNTNNQTNQAGDSIYTYQSEQSTQDKLKEPQAEQEYHTENQAQQESQSEQVDEWTRFETSKSTNRNQHGTNQSLEQKIADLTSIFKRNIDLEQLLSTKLLVWIAGIALVLAGFFLVRYSIENSLMSPGVRVILGGISGVVLIYLSGLVNKRPNFANGKRITQALTGAGIAVLYLSLFSATSLYDLIPNFMGFIGMSVVTALTIILALRRGMPIALLGMLGGFFTPLLINSSNPSTPILFIYLFLVFSSLMLIIRQKNWWVLALPALGCVLFWTIGWMFFCYSANDAIWLSLFLCAVCITIVSSLQSYIGSHLSQNKNLKLFRLVFTYAGLGCSMTLLSIAVGMSGFNLLQWSLFALLSLAGVCLAYFNAKQYSFVPVLSLLVNAIMLFNWHAESSAVFAYVLTGLFCIYALSGYLLMWRTYQPLLWGSLATAASSIFYLLAYVKLNNTELVNSTPFFWGSIALLISAIAVFTVNKIIKRDSQHPHKKYLVAMGSALAAWFVFLGLAIELSLTYLSAALAAEAIAIAWINHKFPIRILRTCCLLLATAVAILALPNMAKFILDLFAASNIKLNIKPWEIANLGISAIMLIGTARILLREADGRIIKTLEIISIILLILVGCSFIDYSFNHWLQYASKSSFLLEKSIISNSFLAGSALCLFLGRCYRRMIVSQSGIGLAAFGLICITGFDIVNNNPLFTHREIFGGNIFNSLLIIYGLPIIWLSFISKELKYLNKLKWEYYARIAMFLLFFIFINTNIRFVYHGNFLSTGLTTNAEIYTYSIVWLLLGAGMLFMSILKNNNNLRHLAFLVLLLTIAKVFLYDASALEGLFRVFSFFGLAVCLLGLSWFYARFR